MRHSRLNHRGNTGRKSEKQAASRVKGKLVPGSGGVRRGEGDFSAGDFLYEHKATTADSFRVTRQMLGKIDLEAQAVGKRSAFMVAFVDEAERLLPPGRFVIVSENVFNNLVAERSE